MLDSRNITSIIKRAVVKYKVRIVRLVWRFIKTNYIVCFVRSTRHTISRTN